MPPVAVPDGWAGAGEDGLAIFHPPRWYATTSRLTRITAPVDLVSVATFDLDGVPAGGDDCSNTPESAIEAMSERDAFLSITGVFHPDAIPDQPPLVGLIDSWPEESRNRSMAVHCADNSDLLTAYTFEFRAGRFAYRALAVFGPQVTETDRETMLLVLNSFRP